ncbi:hypothetical protein [Staphylococcus equorum]|uniref:Uncharacterized protein n=1 Tax=Staphylococcus equorum TaxID=246432 RepID=A0AAP7IGH5_9STAP|nr:hypothetical protein [Staphylococcus equorum]OEK58973.1 hypothetical protein ASS94_01205 [Staphylococcus equorum]
MILLEQLVTLNKRDLIDITFEGQSIYSLQDVIQEVGISNENIIYETRTFNQVEIKLKNVESDEKEKIEAVDTEEILYEEVLTLDVEYKDGFIIHINK